MNHDGKRCIDVSKNINKLYDHINLDIARINNSKAIELKSFNQQVKLDETIKKFDDKIQLYTETTEKLNTDINTFEKKSSVIENELKINKKKAQNMQREYITILGVFSSVVLAFIGGIAFSTSVLENIEKASIFRLLFIVLIIAFVFLNMIYLLVRFIIDINALDDKNLHYSKHIKRINSALLILAILVILAWIIDLPYLINKLQSLYKI